MKGARGAITACLPILHHVTAMLHDDDFSGLFPNHTPFWDVGPVGSAPLSSFSLERDNEGQLCHQTSALAKQSEGSPGCLCAGINAARHDTVVRGA